MRFFITISLSMIILFPLISFGYGQRLPVAPKEFELPYRQHDAAYIEGITECPGCAINNVKTEANTYDKEWVDAYIDNTLGEDYVAPKSGSTDSSNYE